jgi:2-polyprenyl-6-methoxyphenol hydroxylase-like FAD-dependent oxidoreductase
MRILICGGGIAGLTLAALLHQRGEQPIVVEKASAYGDVGYLLSLWSLGNRVLHGLELFNQFREMSAPLNHYILHGVDGDVIKNFELNERMEKFGEIRTLARSDLLTLLLNYGNGIPVKTNCTVETLEQKGDVVQVRLSDESEHECDLVVGADGIHSKIRRLL